MLLKSRQGAGQGQVAVVAKSIIGEISASAPQRTRIFSELWSDGDWIYPILDECQVDYDRVSHLQALYHLWTMAYRRPITITAHLPFFSSFVSHCPVSTNLVATYYAFFFEIEDETSASVSMHTTIILE
jgi:hypothetical protein